VNVNVLCRFNAANPAMVINPVIKIVRDKLAESASPESGAAASPAGEWYGLESSLIFCSASARCIIKVNKQIDLDHAHPLMEPT